MQGRKGNQPGYEDYVGAMRAALAEKSFEKFPRLIVVHGPSPYLQIKTFDALKKFWLGAEWGAVHSLESAEIDQKDFLGFVLQASLFEPRSLYILRRISAVKNFGTWLAAVKDVSMMRSNFVLDVGEKITADLQKQLTRLNATMIPCVEPSSFEGCRRIAVSLAKRHQLNLSDDAMNLLIDATGQDLGKIENEIVKLALQFSGVEQRLNKTDISPSLGTLREDDIFELFRLLREKKYPNVHLMTEAFLSRGESAVAITGIFAKFAREQIERGATKLGLAALYACAEADRQLKSSGVDDVLVLSRVIEAFSEV